MTLEWWTRGKPSVLGMISGAVAGWAPSRRRRVLSCRCKHSDRALRRRCLFLGLTSLKPSFGYDNSLDVFGVHGIGGLTGTLLAGVFAVGALSATPDLPDGVRGLLEGNPQQLLAQIYGVAVTALWSGALTYLILKAVSAVVPLRVNKKTKSSASTSVSTARRCSRGRNEFGVF